jgi:hypothetical protein
MIKTIKLLLFVFVLSAAFSANARAGTIQAASCSQSDVQIAIGSASSGDVVQVPGGSATWSGQVLIPNTVGIILDGGGCNLTISSPLVGLVVLQNASTTSEVRNFTFTNCNSPNNPVLSVSGTSSSATFRIDNNTFNVSGGSKVCLQAGGDSPGLIDHNTFIVDSTSGGTEVIHNVGMGAENASGWLDDVVPGNSNMVFIETNTFTFNCTGNPCYYWGTSAVQSYYGARTVFRYNNVTMMQVDTHGSCGAINGRWTEVYKNAFTTVNNANQAAYVVMRGGGGLIWGNSQSGPNLGGGSIQITEDCTSGSYPMTDQIGRGINQTLSPMYLWGNAANMGVIDTNTTFIQLNRDYYTASAQPSNMVRCQSAADVSAGCPVSYTYTPYTYPHPLTAGSSSPAPPTNVSATIEN